MDSKKYVVLKDVEFCWAYLAEPNSRGDYASHKYQVDVIITEDQKKTLEELKFSPKQKIRDAGDGRYSLTLKSSIKPRVVDNDKMPMDAETVGSIGNGSIGNIKVVAYESRGAIFLGLSDVRIKKLVKYSGGNSVDDLFEDGEVTDSVASDDETDDDDIG